MRLVTLEKVVLNYPIKEEIDGLIIIKNLSAFVRLLSKIDEESTLTYKNKLFTMRWNTFNISEIGSLLETLEDSKRSPASSPVQVIKRKKTELKKRSISISKNKIFRSKLERRIMNHQDG
ncbi:unnamed protein product [Nezara viridula]|uniref:Uncharacterized protein n=1 Tax=Nezara viridula TaxID=85310 RepID=A0A9P0H2Y7_NEZVI|nr:unnamed protein product [Nezara viridula]